MVLYTNPNFSPKNLKELAELAKTDAKINYASAGVGTTTHLTAELFKTSRRCR